ncbi:MAG: Putative oxidoreductase, partial [uncultured Frankineae bacterium]
AVPHARPQRDLGLDPVPGHHDVRRRDRRGGRPRAARRVRRGRRHARRHRRRLLHRGVRDDHRPLAGLPPGRGARPGRAGHQGPVPDGRRAQRRRHLAAPPAARPRRLPEPPGRRARRPLPAARLGPADPARGDAALPRRRGARRQDRLPRAVELHRLAGAEGGRRGGAGAPGRARDAPACLQPAGARHRARDRPCLRAQRARPAPLEPARWRVAVGQVHPRPAPHRGHPAGRRPRSRHRGVRPGRRPGADLGRPRGGAGRRRGARRPHGAGGPGLAGRPAGRLVGHPRGPHHRAAAPEPRRGRAGADGAGARAAGAGQRPGRGRLPVRRARAAAAQPPHRGRAL